MDKTTEKEIIEFDLKCQKLNLLKKNNTIKTLYLTNNEFTVLAKEKIRSYNGSNGTKAIKIFI